MRVKSMFIFLVLNIFTVMAVSILYEYISIQDKLTQLENTVSLSLERAVYNSTASEELFTEKFADTSGLKVYSYGTSNGSVGSASDVSNSILVWDGDKFVKANAYGLTIHNVGFPVRQTGNSTGWTKSTGTSVTRLNSTNLATINGHNSTEVFEYLYGDVTNKYNTPDLSWANTGSDQTKADATKANALLTGYTNGCTYAESNGANLPSKPKYTTGVREDFYDFYRNIGHKIVKANFVKEKTEDSGYQLSYQVYPVLADMGLPVQISDGKVYAYGTDGENSKPIMTDNWCQVAKIGKRVSDGSVSRSYYYLTPYSLGITYIPKDVLKETFLANLDTVCRFTKLGSSALSYGTAGWSGKLNEEATVKDVLNSATGCLGDTNVYKNGGATAEKHKTKLSENIINDGIIEYDLNSVQTKIEYFVVDFWNEKNALIVDKCVGEVEKAYSVGYTNLSTQLKKNVADYKNNDSGYQYLTDMKNKNYKLNGETVDLTKGYTANQGNTIVAKVSVRVKVHIPYDNPLMQWAVNKYTHHSDSTSEHYDIKLYNEYNTAKDFRTHAYTEADGVWYQTSTYFALTN